MLLRSCCSRSGLTCSACSLPWRGAYPWLPSSPLCRCRSLVTTGVAHAAVLHVAAMSQRFLRIIACITQLDSVSSWTVITAFSWRAPALTHAVSMPVCRWRLVALQHKPYSLQKELSLCGRATCAQRRNRCWQPRNVTCTPSHQGTTWDSNASLSHNFCCALHSTTLSCSAALHHQVPSTRTR